MKIFIFNRIKKCSCNYHEEGGLVIIAESIEHAKELIKQDKCISISAREWKNVESFDLIGNIEPKFWVMPDAGCC